MRRSVLVIIAFVSLSLCLVTPIISQNYVLQINSALGIPDDCKTIYAGSTVQLERGVNPFGCDEDVVILKDGDPAVWFRASAVQFSVPFDEPGEYVVYCGVPRFTTMFRSGTTAACFTVLPQAVPTIGDWGLIILGLSMLILSVLFIKVLGFRGSLT